MRSLPDFKAICFIASSMQFVLLIAKSMLMEIWQCTVHSKSTPNFWMILSKILCHFNSTKSSRIAIIFVPNRCRIVTDLPGVHCENNSTACFNQCMGRGARVKTELHLFSDFSHKYFLVSLEIGIQSWIISYKDTSQKVSARGMDCRCLTSASHVCSLHQPAYRAMLGQTTHPTHVQKQRPRTPWI